MARSRGLGDVYKRQVLFFPDQHLGRNTGYDMGYTADDMVVWDPKQESGGISYEDRSKRFILWKGHCTTHQRFKVEQIEQFRYDNPGAIIVVHPECSHEVCEASDQVGSTDFIIKAIEKAEPGTAIGIATEINLVNRLRQQNPDKNVMSLDPIVCPCSTMNRIDPAHLAWILEGLVDGKVRNVISVDPEAAKWAKVALDRMLELI
jgi:quinolinate synthase